MCLFAICFSPLVNSSKLLPTSFIVLLVFLLLNFENSLHTYSGFKASITYTICNYFLSVHGLFINSLNSSFDEQKF